MLVEGPAHVAAEADGRLQRCRRCSTELAGSRFEVGQLVVERHSANGGPKDAINLEPVSRNGAGTIYLCDEKPPAAFI